MSLAVLTKTVHATSENSSISIMHSSVGVGNVTEPPDGMPSSLRRSPRTMQRTFGGILVTVTMLVDGLMSHVVGGRDVQTAVKMGLPVQAGVAKYVRVSGSDLAS